MEKEQSFARSVSSTSSDRVRIVERDTCIHATLAGLFGLRECLGAHLMLRRAVDSAAADRALIDIRGCVLTMTPGQYVTLLRAAISRPLAMPVAYVAESWVMALASAHERVMGRRGFPRRFFASEPAATRWLARVQPGPREQQLDL